MLQNELLALRTQVETHGTGVGILEDIYIENSVEREHLNGRARVIEDHDDCDDGGRLAEEEFDSDAEGFSEEGEEWDSDVGVT